MKGLFSTHIFLSESFLSAISIKCWQTKYVFESEEPFIKSVQFRIKYMVIVWLFLCLKKLNKNSNFGMQ